MSTRERRWDFSSQRKRIILRVKLWKLEGSFSNRIVTLNIFTWMRLQKKKKFKGSDYTQGSQVFHRLQKSKLMLYNSASNNKTTTTTKALQGLTSKRWRDSMRNPESSTLKGLDGFSTLLDLVWLDTGNGVPSHKEGWEKLYIPSAFSCLYWCINVI